MRWAGATDLGLRREHNEDTYAIWTPGEPAEQVRRGVLLLVADGMGGSAAGEVASHAAAEAVLRHFREREETGELALTRSLEVAHRAVHRLSQESPDLAGMGTTVAAASVLGTDVRFAHVGDSRVYLVRDGHIRQLTVDHSLVQQLVEQQLLTPEQARVDPRRNVLTRSIGVGESVQVDESQLAGGLKPGDTLLLCSDGLYGMMMEDEMARLASLPDLDRACQALIELARERGGHDNITVVLARLVPDAPDPGGA